MDSKSSVIGSLYPNDEIDVLSITDLWARIEYKGRVAYVSSEYIRKFEVQEDITEYNVNKKESISDIDQEKETKPSEIHQLFHMHSYILQVHPKED